jgi:hypothetical protein
VSALSDRPTGLGVVCRIEFGVMEQQLRDRSGRLAAGYQEGQVRHDDNVWVVKVCQRRREELVEFPLSRQAEFDDLLTHTAYEINADRAAGVAVRIGVSSAFDIDVHQSGRTKELGHLPSDSPIGAVSGEDRNENLDQPFVGRVTREAHGRFGVGFEAEYPPARLCQANHLLDHLIGPGKGDQKRTSVNDIKGR